LQVHVMRFNNQKSMALYAKVADICMHELLRSIA
jgi:hypothetical protein